MVLHLLIGALVAGIIVIIGYYLFEELVFKGPVNFSKKEIGEIFYVLHISENNETAELARDFPAKKGQEYFLPNNTPKLEIGKTYELGSYEKNFFLERVSVMTMVA